jgi:hypothetical protein
VLDDDNDNNFKYHLPDIAKKCGWCAKSFGDKNAPPEKTAQKPHEKTDSGGSA